MSVSASALPPPPAAPVPRFVIGPAGRLLSSLGCLLGGWLALVALFFVLEGQSGWISRDEARLVVSAGLAALLFIMPVWLVVVLPLFLAVPHRSWFWSFLCVPLCFGMVGFGVMFAFFRFDTSPFALRFCAVAALVGFATGLCAAVWQRALRRRAEGKPPSLWPAPWPASGPRFVIGPSGRAWRSLVCSLGGWLVTVACHFFRDSAFAGLRADWHVAPVEFAIYSLPSMGMLWLFVTLPLFLRAPHRSRFWLPWCVAPFYGIVGSMVMNPLFPFEYTAATLRLGGWGALAGVVTGLFCAAWQRSLRERAASLTHPDAAD